MKMYEKKKKAVVPRLRFPEFRDAGEWEVKRLGNVYRFRNFTIYGRDRIISRIRYEKHPLLVITSVAIKNMR